MRLGSLLWELYLLSGFGLGLGLGLRLKLGLRLRLNFKLLRELHWYRYRVLKNLMQLLDGRSHGRRNSMRVRRGRGVWRVRDGRNDGRRSRRRRVVRRRDNGGMLRGPAIGLLQRHEVLHGRL